MKDFMSLKPGALLRLRNPWGGQHPGRQLADIVMFVELKTAKKRHLHFLALNSVGKTIEFSIVPRHGGAISVRDQFNWYFEIIR